tara:strand:+ start:248 stop:1120 length:873 start_codon:yes stop_codon:yes gene_type:complete
MIKKINCEYCNKLIYITHKSRHYNSRECRNKQQNKDIILPLKEYKCKYCEIIFNRIDKQHEHELICTSKDIYYKFQKELELKEKENKMLIDKYEELLKQKNGIIKQKEDDINYFKTQLQIYRPSININHDNSNNNITNNITINNTININFNDIQKHLDKFNIHVLSDQSSLINFIMPIFENKVKLINECKQIMSFYSNDKLINDVKCKVFLSNSAGQLTEISDKICTEGKNNKLLSDTIIKNACINNKLLNEISTNEGIKNGIRKKNPMILVHEIIKYLKENNIVDIRGV